MQAFVAAGAGFLLAVLWFDLMFDVQAARGPTDELPEPVLASISGYYRRVTTDARPMNRLVALAMAATAGGIAAELIAGRGPAWARWTSLGLVVFAVGLAGLRTVPNAVRLGRRGDPLHGQRLLARAIYRDHLACLAAIAATLVVQLSWVR